MLIFALFGLAIEQLFAALFVGTSVCLIWHLHQLYRLERWLHAGSLVRPWQVEGIWSEVYHHVLRLQRRHREREHKLTEILDQFQEGTAAVPDAAVVLNEDAQVLWCNEASQRLLGLCSPQDSGRHITHLVRHPAFVGFLAKGPYKDSVEIPAPTNSDLLLNVRIVPYGQDQRLLLATDVTRIHRLEQVRRDFVSNVSHELRTPLTVIGGYLETLQYSEDACAEKWRQPLRRMQEQTGRMLHIIEDLLMLTRLETQADQKPSRPVAVPDLLRGIADDARLLSGEKGHEIRLEVDSTLWLRGIEQELRSAFSNLVFNAVRHTPAGRCIILRWFTDERGIHFEVEDNGEGIPPQHIPRLTERFYRVDRGRQRETGGSGLGLAIVKHVMNSHGGQLRVASRLGEGSVFTCDFPSDLRAAADVSKALLKFKLH